MLQADAPPFSKNDPPILFTSSMSRFSLIQYLLLVTVNHFIETEREDVSLIFCCICGSKVTKPQSKSQLFSMDLEKNY